MKRIIGLSFTFLVIAACGKDKGQLDVARSYSVEGYIISKRTAAPLAGRAVAISQQSMVYKLTDPQTTTDTNGYFKLIYTPTGSKDGLNVYPVYEDYECIYHDISFIVNIPKYQNVDLKKIYTSQF